MIKTLNFTVSLLILFTFIISCSSKKKVTNFDDKTTDILNNLKNQIEDRRDKGHHILSPQKYSEAQDYYKRAKQMAESGRNFDEVKKVTVKGEKKINEINESLELAKVHLPRTLKARSEALKEGAQYTNLFKDADKELLILGNSLEEKDINKVIDEKSEVRKLYVAAEIKAIEDRVLKSARNSLEKAQDEPGIEYFEPELKMAKSDLYSARKLISKYKDSSDKYKNAVSKAEDSAERLLVLANAGSWVEDNNTRSLVLDLDRKLNKVLNAANYQMPEQIKFKTKMKIIQSEAQKISYLRSELTDAQIKLVEKKWQIDNISSDKKYLSEELEKRLWSEEKLSEIRSLFDPEEAEIFVKKEDLIVQLKGLNFGFDKAKLPNNSDEILSKVILTLKKMNYPKVTIIGHADSIGDSNYNQELSKKRAINLNNYLLNNSPMKNTQIQVKGMGYEKPLTANKDWQGRQKNRRIDVVLNSVVR